MANGSLLQAIARPEIANIAGQFEAGRQSALQRRLIESKLAEQEQGVQLRGALSESVGTPQFQSNLRQFAVAQPQAAQNVQQVFAGISEENLRNAFTNIQLASTAPIQDQNIRLEAAKESFEGRPEFQRALTSLQNATPEQREEMFKRMTRVGQQLGVLEEVKQPGITPEQREREITVKEQAQETRESELEARTAETRRKAGELKPTMQKILDEAQTIAFDSEKTANGFELLSKDFDRLGFSGGVKASIGDFLKDALGTQDEVSALRRKFRGIRASQAMKNLPPGPASDKDIALALGGFPPENAPASVISSFIKGASKLARIDQAFQTFKAEYISENKNTAGLIKAWKQNKTRIVGDAVKSFEAGATPPSTVIMRHPTLGDITEEDIQTTMESNKLTREQVLQGLRGQ
jgi:hypothetical protein